MKKSFLFLISFFAFLFQAQAQTLRPLLFEIQKEGDVAYLLGTMHTGVGYSALPAFVTEKVNNASTIVIESDLEAAGQLIQQKFPMPSPTSLKSLLTEQEWTLALSKLAPFGVTEEKLDSMYPFVVASLLAMVDLAQVADPMDATLAANAKQAGKTLDFLESPESALKVLEETMSLETLKATLAVSKENSTAALNELVSAYKQGDEELLLASMKADKTLTPENLKMLLTERNKAWIPEFSRIIKNNGTEFFAFGAGHLGGSDGILALLKNEGYTIKRLEQ